MTASLTAEALKSMCAGKHFRWSSRSCSICGAKLHYVVDDSALFYENVCRCSSRSTPMEFRSWEGLAELFLRNDISLLDSFREAAEQAPVVRLQYSAVIGDPKLGEDLPLAPTACMAATLTGPGAMKAWLDAGAGGKAEEPTAFLRWNNGTLEQQWMIGDNMKTRTEWHPIPSI